MKKNINLLIGLSILAITIYRIIDRLWVTEDAYITFKHIDNFFAGNGLTFNKGTKVESFTHPLWVGILIIFRFLTGISNHTSSLILGIIFSISTVLFLFCQIIKKADYRLPIFILPALYVFHQGFVDFSTSGLENSLTFLFITLLITKIWDSKIPEGIFVPTLLGLFYLIRPEFILVGFYYGIVYMIQNFNREKYLFHIFKFAIIPILLIGGYHLFRFLYFGEIFPMSYHAKAGSGSDWQHGFAYLLHTIRYSPLLTLLLVLTAGFLFYKFKKYRRINLFILRDIFAMFIAAIYIIRMGGDFMAFRLLLPSLLIYYIILAYYLNERFTVRPNIVILFNILFLGGAIYYAFFYKDIPFVKGTIADERKVYYRDFEQSLTSRFKEIKYKWYGEGTKFNSLQSCLDYEPFVITNSITDAKCSPGVGLGYFSVAAGTNVKIIDELGFTDKNVQMRKVEEMRPGHLKRIDLDYVIESGSLFCSLDDPRYDSIFTSQYGVLIGLDNNLLFSLGNKKYSKSIKKLKQLYEKISDSEEPKDKNLFSKLTKLEIKWKKKILELPDSIPVENVPEKNCWKN
jgi:arabinofuranosyltransferase